MIELTTPPEAAAIKHLGELEAEALKAALDKHRFDACFGDARRDEGASRAKERVFRLCYCGD